MRMLRRNKQKYYYALYKDTERVANDKGQLTGEKRVVYTEPVEAYGNISAARGNADVVQFGTNVDYDNVIVVEDTELDENSVIWYGVEPSKPYNYIVKRVSRSLNSVAIAIKKVDVG